MLAQINRFINIAHLLFIYSIQLLGDLLAYISIMKIYVQYRSHYIYNTIAFNHYWYHVINMSLLRATKKSHKPATIQKRITESSLNR